MSDNESVSYAANGYTTRSLSGGLNVVYSTQRDSLPVTSIRIGSQPCVQAWKAASDNAGTTVLPNEI